VPIEEEEEEEEEEEDILNAGHWIKILCLLTYQLLHQYYYST
jgi:hypothetical protein